MAQAFVPAVDTIIRRHDGELPRCCSEAASGMRSTPPSSAWGVCAGSWRFKQQRSSRRDDDGYSQRNWSRIRVVASMESNVKLTTPNDLILLQNLVAAYEPPDPGYVTGMRGAVAGNLVTPEPPNTQQQAADCSVSVKQACEPAVGQSFEDRTSDHDLRRRCGCCSPSPTATHHQPLHRDAPGLPRSTSRGRAADLQVAARADRGYDVFHAHWPEILVNGHRPLKTAVRQVLFLVMLIRLRLRGTAIVRTLHNLELPDGISRRESVLLSCSSGGPRC